MATKTKNFVWRASEEELARVKRLADDYGVSMSALFRFAMQHVDALRPPMTTTTTIKSAARRGKEPG